jgi:hypothetical protein
MDKVQNIESCKFLLKKCYKQYEWFCANVMISYGVLYNKTMTLFLIKHSYILISIFAILQCSSLQQFSAHL